MQMYNKWVLAGSILVLLATFGTPEALESSATPLQQLFLIKEMVANAQTVGVILNTSTGSHADLIAKIQRASAQIGVKVVIAEVSQLSEIAEKFRDLKETYHIQVLWIAMNDNLVGSSISRDYLIKNSTLSGIPVFAPNSDWVTAGACVAVGSNGSELKLYVNKKTLNALGMKVPDKYIPITEFLASN